MVSPPQKADTIAKMTEAAGLKLTTRATTTDVRNVLVHIDATLLSYGALAADAGAVQIVLAEALNNIVAHAGCSEEDLIDIHLWKEPDAVGAEIVDPGRPMPGPLPDPHPVDPETLSVEDLPEGGFGWCLIRSLADDLRYARENGQNHLSLRIRII